MDRPLISVICPSYDRPQHVGPLLDSVLAQDFDDWECVITDDHSPSGEEVRAIFDEYSQKSNGKIRCYVNDENLGYDGAFRRLIELARGRFVFVMGDDDFVAPGALRAVADAIARYPNLGVILRAFAFFRDTPNNILQVNRYYPAETRFPAGPQAIVACYRRLVGMSGLVLDRDASSLATDRWDGTLFYQHWWRRTFLSRRTRSISPSSPTSAGRTPLFGRAKAEQGLYTPGVQPPETDIKMLMSLMAIADAVERERGVRIAELIRRDHGNYMYPTIAHQAHQPWPVFYKFYRDLARMGFGRYPLFHFWFWSVAAVGATRMDRLLQIVRRRVGHTPNLSSFARGGRKGGPVIPSEARDLALLRTETASSEAVPSPNGPDPSSLRSSG
jgi:glycosyltransferase involved in cell wall biosynthesis